jgi:peptide/nickel transport system substrate-binding protein
MTSRGDGRSYLVEPGDGEFSRREFLKRTGLGATTVASAGLLAACGSSASPAALSGSKAKPKRGGYLRLALTGGSSSDTLDADNPVQEVDFSRVNNLYEPLVYMNFNAETELWLAEELTPNATATSWTIRVRKGVTFHNGKTLGADDVIYTFQRILNPKAAFEGAPALAPVDGAGIKKLDQWTVQIPCTQPFVTFPEVLSVWYYNIVPVGYDVKKPVGTGPFRFSSFTPGERSEFLRYDDYWRHPLPYLDGFTVVDFADETSQVNALNSGATDAVNLLSAPSIDVVKSAGGQILISRGGGFTPFTMRVDAAPFKDVRVRQAMRLIVDRPKMLDILFGGYGQVGNDVFGIWAPEYDHALPQRVQDIAQAKSLLKQAGQEGLTVELITADVAQASVNAAQVFQQQARAAGVNVVLRQLTVDGFFTNYLKWVFAQTFWFYNYYLPQVALATLPNSPYPETHFDDPVYNRLYAEAVSTLDQTRRIELAHEMQVIDYTQGGYILPFFPPVIDGFGPHVHGFVPSKTGLSFNNYNFAEVWLD